MWSFERRWAQAILEAYAPPSGPGLAPRPGEVDYLGTLDRMVGYSGGRGRAGFRAALWLVALSPMWSLRGFGSIVRLGLEARTTLLSELMKHRVHPVRELTNLLKVVAAFAMLSTPSVRARSGYDRVETQKAQLRVVQEEARS